MCFESRLLAGRQFESEMAGGTCRTLGTSGDSPHTQTAIEERPLLAPVALVQAPSRCVCVWLSRQD